MSMELELVKEEPGLEGDEFVEALAYLYAEHEVKEEVLVDPESLQHPDVMFTCQTVNNKKPVISVSHTKKIKTYVNKKLQKPSISNTEKCQILSKNNTGRLQIPAEPTAVEAQKPSKTNKEKELFSCHVCEMQYTFKYQLERHIRKHTKPIKCEFCDKKFAHPWSYKIHAIIHTGEKPFACEICGKNFGRGAQLIRHSRVHTKEKPYQCDICHKQFSDRSTAVRHTKIHNGVKTHCCEICGKKFARTSEIISHMPVHTGIKNYFCDICHKTFARKSNLVQHLSVHIKMRRYGCNLCGKKFNTTSALTKHMWSHETGAYLCDCGSKFLNSKKFAAHKRRHSGGEPYSCKCGELFELRCQLNKHSCAQRMLYFCDICGGGYETRRNLVRHIRLHKKKNSLAGSMKCD